MTYTTDVAITFDSTTWRTTSLFGRAEGALLAVRSVGTAELPGREIEDWSVVVEIGRRDTAAAAAAPRREARAVPRAEARGVR